MADAQYRRASPATWLDDIQVVTDHGVNTTGKHKVWTAARRLRDYLEAEAEVRGLCQQGLRVLELGAGCGWLGLTLARNLPGCYVLMTEQAEGGAVEHLWTNIKANLPLVGHRVEAACLDWRDCEMASAVGQPDSEQQRESRAEPRIADGDSCVAGEPSSAAGEATAAGGHVVWDAHWDLVIGSDLVYNDVGVHVLPRVLERLVGHGAAVLYGHTLGRFELMDIDFKENLEKLGMVVRQVVEAGEEQQEAEEEGNGVEEEEEIDLFPELRPVVFAVEFPPGKLSRAVAKFIL